MKNLFRFLPIVTLILLASSCAKEPNEDTSWQERVSFDAWMAKNINNNGIRAVKQDNGMYVEYLSPATDPSLVPADTTVWVRINYTGRTLQNNVYLTRYREIAEQQGTYTPYTYYAPDYLYCGPTNSNMIQGQYAALKEELKDADGNPVKLAQGSRVRIYMPSDLSYGAYGTSNDQGYGGQYALVGNVPSIEEMEIVEVVKDPIKREEKLVTDYAWDNWGMGEEDTLRAFLYLHSLSLPEDTVGTSIGVDSTIKFYYVGYFLDGFVFDTNIDSVQQRLYGEVKTSSAIEYTPSEDKESYVSALYYALPAMRKGEWAEALFTSAYGYGVTGLSAATEALNEYYSNYLSAIFNNGYFSDYSSYYNNYYYTSYYYSNYLSSTSSDEDEVITEVQSYTPLIFRIYVMPDED